MGAKSGRLGLAGECKYVLARHILNSIANKVVIGWTRDSNYKGKTHVFAEAGDWSKIDQTDWS